jgi:peptidylprolyl isomerase
VPPTKRILALALGASLLLACGDDDDAGAGAGITVDGEVGEDPTIEIPDGFEPSAELVVEDLAEGDGDEVLATSTVSVFYEGVLLDGSEFDGNFGSEAISFPLDQVIPGWTEGLQGMQVGGRRLLVIPPDLAYGASGRPGIPPDATLVFVVDVVGVS